MAKKCSSGLKHRIQVDLGMLGCFFGGRLSWSNRSTQVEMRERRQKTGWLQCILNCPDSCLFVEFGMSAFSFLPAHLGI